MWSYLKAAFWARPDIPALGRVPLNVILLSGLGLLGFGHPGFWMAGMAAEMAYLYALTTNARFQKLVDADSSHLENISVEKQQQILIETLTPPRRAQLETLAQKCGRILQLHGEAQSDDFTIEGNREALQKIQWLYLKLLVAQQNIQSLGTPAAAAELQRQIDLVRHDLRADKLSRSLKESKEATLKILLQRLENMGRRSEHLAEIASDLTRIEAQVDLALENAGMSGKSETISTNIDLVSQLLDDSIYGDNGASIAALDESYAVKNPA